MFNIEKDSIFYVLAPAKVKTGGPELAHQLVYEMNKCKPKNTEVYITYYNTDGVDKKDYTNPSFKKYITEYRTIDDIIDDKKNIIIATETYTGILKKFKNIQKAIFWMSVDNFARENSIFFHAKQFGWPRAIKRSLAGQIKPFFKIDPNIIHFYQSEYAKDYVKKHGGKKIYQLSDYLNEGYLKEDKAKHTRKNVVLYNPKKGYEFTKKIIESCPDCEFIPLINLTNEQVRSYLLTSKVYIDFGNHPGKDRFPREAAISGCCIITGKRGSAAYFEDVAIPDEYKFNDKKDNIGIIVKRIKYCIENFEEATKDFDNYRKKIKNEPKEFEKDVKAIFK